jgi:DNA (cytosine-5)-methyltransferase 1
MAKNLPSAALTTRCISLSNGRFGHPTQHRAISVREAACLQTFPMDFEFFGSLASMSRQVGNAVPVVMARVFGEAIRRHYKRHRTKELR